MKKKVYRSKHYTVEEIVEKIKEVAIKTEEKKKKATTKKKEK